MTEGYHRRNDRFEDRCEPRAGIPKEEGEVHENEGADGPDDETAEGSDSVRACLAVGLMPDSDQQERREDPRLMLKSARKTEPDGAVARSIPEAEHDDEEKSPDDITDAAEAVEDIPRVYEERQENHALNALWRPKEDRDEGDEKEDGIDPVGRNSRPLEGKEDEN